MAIPYYRRNLYVLWLATFLVSASWTQVIPFLPLFLSQLGVTENLNFWSGLAVSAHFITGMIMMPVWGKLGDRFGRKPMLIRAGLSLSVIYFLTSLSTEAWHVVAARLANGALTGFIPMSISLVGTNTPPQYSARYVASVQTSSAIGTIVGPVIGGTLAGIFGVRGSLQASAALVFISALLAIFFVQERRKPEGGGADDAGRGFSCGLSHARHGLGFVHQPARPGGVHEHPAGAGPAGGSRCWARTARPFGPASSWRCPASPLR